MSDVKQEKAMSGAQMIDNERTRQITDEGWSAAHDDEHVHGELAWAGACYADHAAFQLRYPNALASKGTLTPLGWPFDASWWKPSPEPIRNMVIGGAFMAAEIDRLQRAKAREVSNA